MNLLSVNARKRSVNILLMKLWHFPLTLVKSQIAGAYFVFLCLLHSTSKFCFNIIIRCSLCVHSTEILQSAGLDGLRAHLFNVLDQVSSYTDTVKQNLKELEQVYGAALQDKEQGAPLVYGAGIQVNPDDPITICGNFSLSKLNTIIDNLEEKYDGIAFPYLYVGLQHTVFPWHIEDGGMYSINYLVGGMPKIWWVLFIYRKLISQCQYNDP